MTNEPSISKVSSGYKQKGKKKRAIKQSGKRMRSQSEKVVTVVHDPETRSSTLKSVRRTKTPEKSAKVMKKSTVRKMQKGRMASY